MTSGDQPSKLDAHREGDHWMTRLDDWQERLARHFGQLRDARVAAGGDHPVFALEHGLETDDIKALVTALNEEITHGPPSPQHALVWIVYATEIGYRYSGDEYWQTFETEMPAWTLNGERIWVRDRYQAFQREYTGAEPTGAWADHFSIICWPITHAILPRDLQRQLSQQLYNMRHSLTAELLESPAELGELIRARSWSATSRFRNLAQDPTLIGQIAAALLLQGATSERGLIHEATLRRIGEDLDRERRARAWLQSARQAARDRVRIRGISPGASATQSSRRCAVAARDDAAVLGIEPRLILHPTESTQMSWDVSLDIPDLSPLLTRLPGSRETLTNTRCRVTGARGRPLARGRCLYGHQRVLLARWPRADELLLKFEIADRQLEYLLSAECMLRPGPSWLFRIASDGLAYESRSLRVRAGERYILATDEPLVDAEHDFAQPITLQCEGVHGVLLDLPTAFSASVEEALAVLGLGCSKTIEIWPAGLSAALWDGNGYAEWTPVERPCLAILSNHPLPGLCISVDEGEEHRLELGPLSPGRAVFVELPALPVGPHTVYLSPAGALGVDMGLLGQLDVVIRDQDARSWSPGLVASGPLIADVSPFAPTLEELWEGRIDLSLKGPSGRVATCQVLMLERYDAVVMRVENLPEVSLPMTSDAWRRYFKAHIQGNEEAQAFYDVVRACEICFRADELGSFTLRCEREFRPLRWSVRRLGQRYVVRLVDDSGGIDAPTTTRIAFETPMEHEPLGSVLEHEVPDSGGLYVARIPGLVAAIVVPPFVRNFDELRCSPRMELREGDVDALRDAIAFARLWGEARLTDNVLSASRQHLVLRALTGHLFCAIGGSHWATAERSFERHPDRLDELKRAVSRLREEFGLGAALRLDVEELALISCEQRSRRLASLGTTFLGLPSGILSAPNAGETSGCHVPPVDTDYLSELALRLASDPARVEAWAGRRLLPGLASLLEVPTLARAARFLVLAIDSRAQGGNAEGNLYAGWNWE